MPRYAAIDIGSNSVRLEVAEVLPGQPPQVLAVDREVTRLGTSVFSQGRISREANELVSKVLARFAATYKSLDVVGVRAVATSAVRDASNQHEFIERASDAAGAPVEIISGPEEARLIHLGVQALWPHPDKKILIVDVGGGSAELIAGENGQFADGVSRPLGAVRLKEVFMQDDPPTKSHLAQMNQFIDEKLAQPLKRLGGEKFDRAIITSATAAAIVCAVNEVPRPDREVADRMKATTAQLRALFNRLSESSLAARRKMVGIGPRRAEIIIPGAAVFLRVMESFKIPAMYYSVAGVRDGIIADLHARGVGKEATRLNKEQVSVVEAMAKKYCVPLNHVRKVAELAHSLFDCLRPLHSLPPYFGKLLEAAAYLHDIGHFVSDTGHHKHSMYLVQNSDMPSFNDRERLLIAMLTRYHRKTMPNQRHTALQSLTPEEKRVLILLSPILRIADALDSGKEEHVESLTCEHRPDGVIIQLQASQLTDGELWAAERAALVFKEVYDKNLVFTRGRK